MTRTPLEDVPLSGEPIRLGQFLKLAGFDCNHPCRKIDTGGPCPHCDKPVTIMDLTDQHVSSSTNRA